MHIAQSLCALRYRVDYMYIFCSLFFHVQLLWHFDCKYLDIFTFTFLLLIHSRISYMAHLTWVYLYLKKKTLWAFVMRLLYTVWKCSELGSVWICPLDVAPVRKDSPTCLHHSFCGRKETWRWYFTEGPPQQHQQCCQNGCRRNISLSLTERITFGSGVVRLL